MSIALIRNVHKNVRLFRHLPVTQKFKNLSSESGNDRNNTKDLMPVKDATQKYSRANVSQYFFSQFFQYISNYDKVLEKKFPSAMHIYRVFSLGVKDFFGDMKMYFKINSIVNGKGIKALTRKEMELYCQMPKDMLKVAPVLLIAALPFMNYVIFPIAYMYPRKLLTSHFWTIQQRVEFQELYLKERTANNKKLFRRLQLGLDGTKDSPYHKEFNYMLGLLGSGTHPTAEEILMVKDVFLEAPYSLKSLSSSHLTYLCKLHGIHSLYLKKIRLTEHGFTMYNMDFAIKCEGGVHNLPIDALKRACYLRGLNPIHLSNEEMILWLREWLKVALEIKTDNMSLYLHLPILFTYNHQNNWRLTHK